MKVQLVTRTHGDLVYLRFKPISNFALRIFQGKQEKDIAKNREKAKLHRTSTSVKPGLFSRARLNTEI